MRVITLILTLTALCHSQPFGWTAMGSNSILTTAVAAPGLTGALVNCPTPSRPYCVNGTAAYQFLGLAKNAVQAQSSAAIDTVHNRMIFTGGGHNDYWGNQVYVADILGGTITRVSDPSGDQNNSGQVNSDGTSPSSHTQQGLVYLQDENVVYKWAIGVGASPQVQEVGWWIDMNTSPPTWVQKGQLPCVGGCSIPSSFYGGQGGNLILDTSAAAESLLFFEYQFGGIFRYTPSTDTWVRETLGANVIEGGTCAVAGTTKVAFCVGAMELVGSCTTPNTGCSPSSTPPTGGVGGVRKYDLTTYVSTDVTSLLAGCSGLYTISNPGFVWDSASSKFVGYTGVGNSVTVFDPVALSCTTVTYGSGPSNPVADYYGIYNDFAYFPSLDRFAVLANATDQMYTLRLDLRPATVALSIR